MRGRWLGWMAPLLFATLGHASAQETEETLNVFLDCTVSGCDFDFLRREITVVNWVRDREVADVHVLITSRANAGGGGTYEISFLGRGDRSGTDQELTWASAGDAVADELRRGVADRVKLGLVRYLVGTPAADRIRLDMRADTAGGPGEGGQQAASTTADPWDFWVFRLSANGFAFGESSLSDRSYVAGLDASRTTEAWKIELGVDFRRSQQTYVLPDTTVKETREDWGTEAALVRSIGSHWAVGVRSEAGSSTFFNQDLRWSLRPGVEFDFFPYTESSRRSLTLQYLVGPQHWDYTLRTIFGRIAETRVQQSLTARLSLVQPWGRWSTSVHGQHYLHDTSKYSVSLTGGLNVRLFKGFSVRMSGNYSWIRDQLYISGEGATDEQILLRQRQLQTSYRYFTSFGVEYRFGSIFNNVVNPRFGGGSEVFFF